MENIIRNVKDSTSKADNVDVATSKVVDYLLEKAILGEVFDFHRAVKSGVLDAKAEQDDASLHESDEGYNIDVFNQQNKAPMCSCPFCGRMIGAARLMEHFQKCTARKGGQISQLETKIRKIHSDVISEDDNDDDYDWVAGSEQSKTARKNIIRNVKNASSKVDNVDVATSKVVDYLIEKAILGEVFDFHRAVKSGVIDEKAELEDGSIHESVKGYNIDVFGQQFKAPVCSCPFCDRMMGAGRLMGHFEKCSVRKGGQSRQQEAKIRKMYSDAISEDDNDDDYDWVAGSEHSKIARKKRDRNKAKTSRAQSKHSPVKDVAVVLDANIFEQLQQADEGVDANGLSLQPKRIAKERHRRKQRKLR